MMFFSFKKLLWELQKTNRGIQENLCFAFIIDKKQNGNGRGRSAGKVQTLFYLQFCCQQIDSAQGVRGKPEDLPFVFLSENANREM